MSNANPVYVIDGELISPLPTPAKIRLNTVRECRRELAKVYAAAKAGVIATQDATRLCYLLTSIATMIRDGELEDRVRALENQIDGSK